MMTESIEALVSGVTEIANHEKVIQHLKPGTGSTGTIERWMVIRVLYALGLMDEQVKQGRTAAGDRKSAGAV